MTFGKRIRSLRTERGWTQADLAKKARVSVRTVNRIETRSGRVILRPDAVARLANALGRPVEEFLTLAAINVTAEQLKSLKNQGMSLGEPLAHAQRRLPVDLLHDVLVKMNGKPALLCVNVTSDRPIDNPETIPIMCELLKKGLFIAVTSPYPNGSYLAAHRSRIPNLVRYYNSVFGRVCGLANQLKNLVEGCAEQISIMKLASQPSNNTFVPFRLAGLAIGVTDNRPCLFYFPGDENKQAEVIIATYIRIGGGRPDHWIVSYPSEGSMEEQERALDTRDTWLDYFSDILSSWNSRTPDSEWRLEANPKRYWVKHEDDEPFDSIPAGE